jgi:hypothetical protein
VYPRSVTTTVHHLNEIGACEFFMISSWVLSLIFYFRSPKFNFTAIFLTPFRFLLTIWLFASIGLVHWENLTFAGAHKVYKVLAGGMAHLVAFTKSGFRISETMFPLSPRNASSMDTKSRSMCIIYRLCLVHNIC